MAAPPTPTSKNTYQVDPLFPAGGGATAADVYVLPPTFQYQSPTTVTVPNVYLPPAPLTVPDGSAYAGDFTLQWNGPGGGTTATTDNTTLTVNILNANQWRSDAGSRGKLQANFAALATALDGMEYTAKSLVPGATLLLLRRVAEMLPAPLLESLFYYYRLSSGLGTAYACPYVDLVPGMRLVVQPEGSQFTAPGAVPQNGPVAGAPLALDLHARTSPDGFRRLAFDGFLGTIASPQVPATPLSATAPQVVAGGVLDLQGSGTARRWYRLLYPTSLPSANSAGDGKLLDSIALVGADSRTDIDAATASYQSGQPATASGNVPLLYWVLRGRAAVIPQISVFVNQATQWLPLGTTVRDVVESLVLSNPYAWDAGQNTGRQLSLYRPMTPSGSPLPQPAQQAVMFNVAQATLSDPRVYDLPLVQGDAMSVTVPNR
jgi:hypothetical protein